MSAFMSKKNAIGGCSNVCCPVAQCPVLKSCDYIFLVYTNTTIKCTKSANGIVYICHAHGAFTHPLTYSLYTYHM